MRSPQFTSSIEPMDTNALNPTFSRRLQSRIALHNAPLWLMNATLPGRASGLANVAFNPRCGRMMPMQFGPITRSFPLRAAARTWCSSATPSGPTSLKPADRMMEPGTPAFTHSSTIPGTVLAGVAMMARSTCLRIAPMLIRRQTQHGRALGIHREKLAAITPGAQILQDRPAHAPGRFRRADDRDVARRKNRVQRVRVVRAEIILGHTRPV